MNTVLTVALVISWLLLLYFLFLFERMEQKLTSLSVVQQQLLRMQSAMAEKLQVESPEDELMDEIQTLVKDGKTYEAIQAYRKTRGVSTREAREFVQRFK
ncbi:hypothetical protein [Alicyclobacillus sp. SO9]|uniref:hypothetical protein n=1 Tax=Alicyclobacillus sp. SO9 TaxID=2665646 RepID=UPI0018E6F6E6|nr:hypothetical protein [Alicyclobacillus sp. SO9]QQE78046.1 hypothetical protein GI364_19440 [Alicyclobacillus sp. SO9]